MIKGRAYVVCLKNGSVTQSKIWHSEKPMSLGHPMGWVLEKSGSELFIREISKSSVHAQNLKTQRVHVPVKGASELVRLSPHLQLQVHATTQLAMPGKFVGTVQFIDQKAKGRDAGDHSFVRSLQATAILAFVLLATLLVLPQKKAEQELIPAQFAKFILTKPAVVAKTAQIAPSAGSVGGSKTIDHVTKLEKSAPVVQAFRSSALRSAASSLLKGGMSKLLAQSDFVSGTASIEKSRAILNAQSSAIANLAPNAGISDGTKVAVASLGGDGQGTGVNKGVGYGKGEKAGVKGQGQSFIKIDTAASSVDEGLTREEVGEVIHKHMSEIRYCYESAILRQPHIEGKLNLAFTVEGSGAVKTVEIRSSTLADPGLDDCILRRLRSWQFPKPRGGVDVAVTYPFIFKSLGG